MLTAPSQPSTRTITVSRVAGHIGAEIGGVDISRPLDPPTVRTIRDALHRHKVLFFRDQQLDHDSHIAFARQFGELNYCHPHDDSPPEGYPQILPVDPERYKKQYGDEFVRDVSRRQYNYFAGWHTDLTAVVNPPAAGILRAATVPEFGGDTTWTNLAAAYQGLSATMRALLDGLRAEHRYASIDAAGNGRYARLVRGNPFVSIHPVVRVHPVTGERALFVNPTMTTHILDVTPAESHALLAMIYAEIARPEYTVRLRWRTGTVAFWDNRATSHLAPRDFGHLGVKRLMYRVTLVGDVPVGVDGRQSEIVAGRMYDSSYRILIEDTTPS